MAPPPPPLNTQRPLKNRALVVPFYKVGRAGPKYMIVRHRPTQEWGLLSGTCTRGEKPLTCAMRELREETKDAVWVSFSAYNMRSTIVILPEGGVRYHVFFVDISNYRSPAAVRTAFHASKRVDKGYDETDGLEFNTLEQLRDKKKVWEVTRFIIRHPAFLKLHSDLCKVTALMPTDVRPQVATARKSPPRSPRARPRAASNGPG